MVLVNHGFGQAKEEVEEFAALHGAPEAEGFVLGRSTDEAKLDFGTKDLLFFVKAGIALDVQYGLIDGLPTDLWELVAFDH